jgi:prepilin-type N-terminal cleavage/methylation domain-containing protein
MKSKGFTLIELLVVISIISLLASVILVALNDARGKARYTKMLSDMRQIAEAAALDYDSRDEYATDVGANTPPAFVGTFLSAWPKPPCPNWDYDWDNWTVLYPNNTVRITAINWGGGSGIYRRKFFYCVTTSGACEAGSGGSPYEVPINTYSAKTISCNEN